MTRQPRPYVPRPIAGLLAKLRDAIAADPGKGSDHYAAAIGAPRIETGIALRKLVKTGMAFRTGQRNLATFTAGRAVIDNRRTPEQLREAQRQRELRYREKRREAYARKVMETQPLRDMLKARKRAEREERAALKALVRKHTVGDVKRPDYRARRAHLEVSDFKRRVETHQAAMAVINAQRERAREARRNAQPDPNAKQREANDRAWVKAQIAKAEQAATRRDAPETSDEFIARCGGKGYEVLPGFTAVAPYKRKPVFDGRERVAVAL